MLLGFPTEYVHRLASRSALGDDKPLSQQVSTINWMSCITSEAQG